MYLPILMPIKHKSFKLSLASKFHAITSQTTEMEALKANFIIQFLKTDQAYKICIIVSCGYYTKALFKMCKKSMIFNRNAILKILPRKCSIP